MCCQAHRRTIAGYRTHFSTRLSEALQLPAQVRSRNKEAVDKFWALAAGTMMLINSENMGKTVDATEVGHRKIWSVLVAEPDLFTFS